MEQDSELSIATERLLQVEGKVFSGSEPGIPLEKMSHSGLKWRLSRTHSEHTAFRKVIGGSRKDLFIWSIKESRSQGALALHIPEMVQFNEKSEKHRRPKKARPCWDILGNQSSYPASCLLPSSLFSKNETKTPTTHEGLCVERHLA